MLKENTILQLNGSKNYLLVEEIIFENNKYVYVVNMEDDGDFMFGEIFNDEFRKINDKVLIGKLLLQMPNN